MNLKPLKTLVFGSLVLVAFSCKKSNDTPAQSKTELLTQSAWKINDYGIDANNNGTLEANESAIQDCEKDNTFSFKTDGTGTLDEGQNICSGENQTTSYNWSFKSNETILSSDNGPSAGDAIIQTLDANNMVLTMDVTIGPNTMKGIIMFKH